MKDLIFCWLLVVGYLIYILNFSSLSLGLFWLSGLMWGLMICWTMFEIGDIIYD